MQIRTRETELVNLACLLPGSTERLIDASGIESLSNGRNWNTENGKSNRKLL
jgi:hypothetical protein